MALKGMVEKLEDVEEGLRSHYKEHTDGKFYLETDQGDIGALVRAKEHEKTLRSQAEAKLDEKDQQIETLTEERDTAKTATEEALRKKAGDVTALEASWQEKLDAEKTGRSQDVESLTGEIRRLLVSDTALRVASEISTVPDLLVPVIERRLDAEKGAEGKFYLRILDGEGKPSAASIDDFKQELLANEKYAAIMVSGKGSGGGAGGSGSGGGAGEKKGFWEYSDEELTKLRNEQPEEFERLKKEAQTTPA